MKKKSLHFLLKKVAEIKNGCIFATAIKRRFGSSVG